MRRNGKDENKDVPFFGHQSSHVPLDRLVALLLSGTPLEPDEHDHILRCDECTVAMVRAAKEELRKRRPRK